MEKKIAHVPLLSTLVVQIFTQYPALLQPYFTSTEVSVVVSIL